MAETMNANGDGNQNGTIYGNNLFSIDKVQLMFSLTDIAFMNVSNNILCIALKSGKLVRIDLDRPEVIDEAELPKKSSETVTIGGIFLDPTGSHLLITTHPGDNYVLSFKSTKPRLLSRLKGLQICSVAWCPFEPSRSTGPILLGTKDGGIYETQIESSNEYFKRDDRYVKQLWKEPNNQPISSLFAYQAKDSSIRKILVTSNGTIWYWQHVMNSTSTDSGPVYKTMFDKSEAIVEHFPEPSSPSFSVSPVDSNGSIPDIFAWANGAGILFGSLNPSDVDTIFTDARVLLNDEIMASTSLSKAINSVILSQYHIFVQYGSSIVIINRLNGKTVFNDYVELDAGEKIVSLISDKRYSTYWLYSSHNIYEIRMNVDEQEEIWRTFLDNKEYEEALKSAKSAYSRDVVNVTYGDHLIEQGDYMRAAELLGSSSKPFEGAAAEFLDKNEFDALKRFIELRLTRVEGSHNMRKVILTSTMIEIFMDKLNEADNKIAANGSEGLAEKEKVMLNGEFKAFIEKYKKSLDKDTIYEIISSHGRQEELLYYANEMQDIETVIRYWVSSENWSQALKLIRQGDVRLAYKYSTVLLLNLPKETVDTWMRLPDLEPTRLLPALLNYSSQFRTVVKPEQNQAIRYLKFAITDLKVPDSVIYNTLISIYSSTPTISESVLLDFLQEHSPGHYDSDFALRICTEFDRIQCSVHILCSIGLYEDALNLALSHDNVELAKMVADKPTDDPDLRKSLWLSIAQNVIKISNKNDEMFKEALKLLSDCDLLKIEDLLSFFPEFTTIGDFKNELISSIEGYFATIKQLDKEMEDSIDTGKNIQKEIQNFKKGYVLIEPGEACGICSFPLATRKFYAFPCQHTFHADCLEKAILKSGDESSKKKIREIRKSNAQKDVADLLAPILSARCILCNEVRVEEIDQPLVGQMERTNSWAM